MDRWVEVSAPRTHNTRVEIEIRASNRMETFIETETFFAEYSIPVEDVPDEILTIPAAANIAPICWATDADLFIGALDRTFNDSIRDIQRVFSDLYPILTTSADMVVDDMPDARANSDADEESGSGLLFSGGIDSLATLVRHHEESPTLITVRGADIGLDQIDAWQRTKSLVSECATRYDLENQYIQSNCYTFINHRKLSALFGCEITDGAWWSGVQHGIGLLGLCAPVASDHGLSDLHIASSYTEEFDRPWGSHPAIDNRVAWSGTTCHHDGFELSRQQKIVLLASHIEQQSVNLPIRVCHKSDSGKNCSRCEKCCRTIIGLMVADADPTDHGFAISEDIFNHVRTQFESGNWSFGFDEVYMWSDIQRHAPVPETVDDSETAAFYQWFREIDPSDYRETGSQGLKRNTRDTLVKNLPYAYFDVISYLYSKLKPSRIGRALRLLRYST